jgi:4-hydroxy-tetrahydrodipicolinate synthase
MSERRRYAGIYPALYAFWTHEGGLDHEAMRAQVEHCIAAGAHGITVLGLVTEVHKMDVNERLHLVRVVGEMIGGRVPYAVTVGEPTMAGQIRFAKAARDAGADWVILQPPPFKGYGEAQLIRFFGDVADALEGLGVAVQNNPVNLDVFLSVQGLVALARQHPNITLLKGEGYSVDIARVIDETSGHFDVFGGHGGKEFPALMRSGGAGLIPAPDCLPVQVRMFDLIRDGSEAASAEAERLHRAILPLIVAMTHGVPTLLTYGKRLFAAKLGLPEPIDRGPATAPTAFGLAETSRHLSALLEIERQLRAEGRAAA